MGGGLSTMFNVFAQGAHISPYGNTMDRGGYGYGGSSHYQSGPSHYPGLGGLTAMFNFAAPQGYYPASSHVHTVNHGHRAGYYPVDPRMSQYGMPLNSDGSPVSAVQMDYQRWQRQGEHMVHDLINGDVPHGASPHHHMHPPVTHDPQFTGGIIPGGGTPMIDPRVAGQIGPGMPPQYGAPPMGGDPRMGGNGGGRGEAPPPIVKKFNYRR